MKTILEFDLPEDSESYENAFNGYRYKITLQEFDEWLRSEIKYKNHPELIENTLQQARDKLNEISIDNEIYY